MSDFDCFCSATEFVDLLAGSLVNGYTIHINKNTVQPIAEICTTGDSLRLAFEAKQYSYILTRNDFTRYQIKLRSILRSGVEYWYPRAKEGGPVIETHFFAPYEKDGCKFIPCSLISYHSKIINPIMNRLELAGNAVKEAFEELVSDLRKRSRRVRCKTRSAFVSPEVDVMLSAGWTLGPPFDRSCD
jgi:hypothetical protein